MSPGHNLAGPLPQKVYLPGKGAITLSPADYLATGGEGAVYAKGGYVYKLYLDPAGARARGIEGKLQLLQGIRHPHIVAPIDVVLDARREVVGFYMPLASGVPLVKTFTNAWRDPNNFGMTQSLELVENMRLAVVAAHQAGAVLVDANEMNFLADGTAPRLLDVDSWQIGNYQANAIMPSIRDLHSNGFSQATDWFSWAIVSFQVLAGIHPYKGVHPDFKRGDLRSRMLANASVFDARVSLNAGVRDFSSLPGALLDWYHAVFQHGLRRAPPSVQASHAVVAAMAALAQTANPAPPHSQTIKHERVVHLPGAIVQVLPCGVALWREPGAAAPLRAYDLPRQQHLLDLGPTQMDSLRQGTAALVRCAGSLLYASLHGDPHHAGIRAHCVFGERDPKPLNRVDIKPLPVKAQRLVTYANRLFALDAHNELGLTEIAIDRFGQQTVLSVKASWPFMAQASTLFGNMALFDALGTPFLVLPTADSLPIVKAPCLAAYRPIDACMLSTNRVVVLAYGRTDGQARRLTLQRGTDGFEVQSDEATDDMALNMAINGSGIGVEVLSADGLHVFSAKQPGSSKLLPATGITQQHRLLAMPTGLHYHDGQDVVRI